MNKGTEALKEYQQKVKSCEISSASSKMKSFELVQVHECGGYAEVVIRDANGCEVFAGNIVRVSNPSSYY